MTGLFGIGGGFLIIPALVLLLGLPMTTAVATSLAIIVINSTASLSAHLGGSGIDYRLAAAFTLAAMAGSLLAGRIASRLPAQRLRRWFAYLVLAVATVIAVQVITTGI